MNTIKKIVRFLFSPFYDQYYKELEKLVVGSGDSLLDVGCGAESPIRTFSNRIHFTVGVDAHEPSLEQSKKMGIHKSYHKMNVLEVGGRFEAKSFDIVLLSDVIEHLKKEDGFRLIQMAETLARKRVIIFTPNGFLNQEPTDGNEYQRHLSGWQVNEMRRLGYEVIGINGLKFLRSDYADIAWKPAFFWGKASLLSQIVATPFPRLAFQILCVKNILTKENN